ncbi:MAG: hypothetical protein FJ123_06265, partial [Deltaproteobacteria bacterium]|nr:hypothetical protein [Deltaproteobacteria bacterium]
MEDRDSEKPYLLEPGEDPILLPDELDIELFAEFPGIEIEDESARVSDEEETPGVGYGGLPGKMVDPVRIYLKEMGSFPLLTREGEVEVAKKIENGYQEILRVVLNCPMAIREIVNLGKTLRTGKITISEIINDADDEVMSLKEEKIQKRKVLHLIHQIDKGTRKIQLLHKKWKVLKKKSSKKKAEEEIKKIQASILLAFKQINLRGDRIDRIIQKLKQSNV